METTNILTNNDVIELLQKSIPSIELNILDEKDFENHINQSFNKTNTTIKTAHSKKSTNKIDDFGEKIGGAKKDNYFTVSKLDINNYSDSELLSLSKSQIFQEPKDYKNLQEEYPHLNDRLLLSIKSLYLLIGDKPRKKYKSLDWAKKTKEILTIIDKLINDGNFAFSFSADDYFNENLYNQYAFLNDVLTLLEFPNDDNIDFNKLKNYQYTENNTTEGNLKYDVYNSKTYFIISSSLDYNTMLSQFLTKANLQIDSNINKSEAKKKQPLFSIYSSRNNIFIGIKIKSNVIKIKEGFENIEDALDYKKNNLDELTQYFEDLKKDYNPRNEHNNSRIGIEHRTENNDVKVENYQKMFGFRGIEFGNYMNQTDRINSLNNSFDAFLDLSSVINFPPHALSLNNKLSIGFGSRGSGGANPASAHYESMKTVINLTKNSGAGSLAHEWFHALDNYFMSEIENKKALFISESGISADHEYIRPEITKSLELIKKAIYSSDVKTRSEYGDKFKSKSYYSQNKEMFARCFESYVKDKLKEIGVENDYLVNIRSIPNIDDAYINKYPYPLENEKESIYGAFDNLFKEIQFLNLEESKIKPFKNVNGLNYGFIENNAIFINKSLLNNNTLIHEYSHIWLKQLEIKNPDLYKHSISLIENEKKYLQFVEDNSFYSKLTKQEKLNEALAFAIGDKGEKIANNKKGFMGFLSNLKTFVSETFFFNKKEQIEKITLDEFLDASVYDLLQGQDLKLFQEKTDEQKESITNTNINNTEPLEDVNFTNTIIKEKLSVNNMQKLFDSKEINIKKYNALEGLSLFGNGDDIIEFEIEIKHSIDDDAKILFNHELDILKFIEMNNNTPELPVEEKVSDFDFFNNNTKPSNIEILKGFTPFELDDDIEKYKLGKELNDYYLSFNDINLDDFSSTELVEMIEEKVNELKLKKINELGFSR